MPIIPVGHGQVNYRYSGSACPTGAEVAIGFRNDGDLSLPDLGALFIDAWDDEIQQWTAAQAVLESVLVKLGPNDTGPQAEFASGLTGAAAGSATPPNVGLLVNKVTALGGRRNRGRSFWPAFTEADVDPSGFIAPLYLTFLQARATAFLNQISTAGANMVVLHSESSLGAPPTVSNYEVQSRVATQRRRLRR